jgi:hypothetical protein
MGIVSFGLGAAAIMGIAMFFPVTFQKLVVWVRVNGKKFVEWIRGFWDKTIEAEKADQDTPDVK